MGGSSGGSSKPQRADETNAERALAEASAKKWQDYQTYSVPLENQYMGAVDKLGTESSKAAYGQRAEALGMQQMQGAQSQLNAGLMTQGVDPSSNKFKTKSMVLNNAIAKTKVNAESAGRFAAENAHLQGMGNVVAMGSGQDIAAFNGMGNLATQAASNAITDSNRDFQIGMQNMADTNAAYGQIAGSLTRAGMSSFGAPTAAPGINGNTTGAANNIGYGYWDPKQAQWVNP